MKRESLAPHAWCIQLAVAALFLVGSLAFSKPARADIDVRFDIGNAPRPSFYFTGRPHRWYDRTNGVYVIDDPRLGDYDAFQYGGYYWVFRDGYWYRSSNWGGNFQVVSPRYVPMAIYDVPSQRWHHHPSYDSVHFRGAYRSDWRDRDMRNRGWRDTGYRRPDSWRDRNLRTRDDSYYRYRRDDRNGTTYDRNGTTYDRNGTTYDRNGTPYDRNQRYDRTQRYDRNGNLDPNGDYDRDGNYVPDRNR